MTVRHQIQDTDTVEYLADKYLGTPERWREIVDYNNLIYPYLSRNAEDRWRVYAEGFVKVTRSTTIQPLTIKKHWTLKTRKNVMSSAIKTYYVTDDLTMPSGVSEAYIHVRSLVPGLQGNTPTASITAMGDDFIRESVQVNLTNEQPITGGAEGFVRITGEYLFIPSDEDTQLLNAYDATFSYDEVKYFYGEDLQIIDDDLVIGFNEDLATVSYLKNVEQAINRRFSTEKGDNLSDFTFGNAIAEIIGDTKLPFEAKQRLVKLEILACLSYEDRVSDPVINSITLVPSELTCYADISMKVVKIGNDITLENVKIGGTS